MHYIFQSHRENSYCRRKSSAWGTSVSSLIWRQVFPIFLGMIVIHMYLTKKIAVAWVTVWARINHYWCLHWLTALVPQRRCTSIQRPRCARACDAALWVDTTILHATLHVESTIAPSVRLQAGQMKWNWSVTMLATDEL